MRIVVMQDDFPPESKGGAGMIAASLALSIKAKGHDVHILAATQDKSLEGESFCEGIPIYRIYSKYHDRWRAWKSLYNPHVVAEAQRLLSAWQPDVVHAHNVHVHLSYAALSCAKKTGARVVLTAHDGMLVTYGKIEEPVSAWKDFAQQKLRYNPLRNICIRRALGNVDAIVAVSHALGNFLQRHGVPIVGVVHNGIDPSEWEIAQQNVESFAAAHGLAGKDVILFGGRISEMKGGDALFKALPLIREARPNAVLALLGNKNSYVERLLRRAQQADISDAVVPLGWLSGDERKAAYHAASVIAVPSIYLDPLPTVVLEAMACAKPVVGSPYGGISEMVEDGVTGRIVDPYNTDEFANAVTALLKNPSECNSYGQAAKQRVQQYFSLDTQVQTMLSYYAG